MIKIRKGVIKVKIEFAGKEIDYGTPGTPRTMRLLTVKDDNGNEFKATAWGKIAKDLAPGKQVFVGDSGSYNQKAKNYFVLSTV